MSRQRTKAKEPLKKGPNGRNLCRWCQKEVQPPKRTFCSDDCVHEYRLRSDPGYLRGCVYDRDQGVCATCSLDTKALKALMDIASILSRHLFSWLRHQLNVPHFGTLWHADHIIPVAEGGGECGLENMETKCLWCHKEKTAQEAKERAKKRKAKKKKS